MEPSAGPHPRRLRAACRLCSVWMTLALACGPGETVPLGVPAHPIVRAPASPDGQLNDVPISFKYEGFTSPGHLQLNGDASLQAPGQLRLTDNTDSAVGSAFHSTAVTLTHSGSFSTFFELEITDPVGGGNGGDGMMFVVQAGAPTALGVGGGDLGYGGLASSFGVEFDTYRDPSQGDLDDQHLGTHSNGNMTSHLQYAASPTNWLGGPREVWVDYDGTTQLLQVRVNFAGDTRPASALLTQSIDLSPVLGTPQVLVGFTAATGSNTDRHFVNRWYFDGSNTPIDVVNNTYVQAPTQLLISASPTSGTEASGITVTVLDADGQPVPGVTVTLTTTLGTLDVISGTTSPDGKVGAVLTAGATAGLAHVVATAPGGLTDSTDVGLVPTSGATVFFNILSSASVGGQVAPSGSVAVASGASQAFTFAADPAHHLQDVRVDGESVGLLSSYRFSNVQASHTVAATFAEDAVTPVARRPRHLDVGFACSSGAGEASTRGWLLVTGLLLRSLPVRERRRDDRTRAPV